MQIEIKDILRNVVLIVKEKYGNALHVSEGHRQSRCPLWSCICCRVFVTKQNTATLLTALLYIGPACRPSAVSVADVKVFVMLSAAEMFAGFINSYMNWDGECRYCGN